MPLVQRPIFALQGTEVASAFDGQPVSTTGIVTAVAKDGFYLQDPKGDGDARTSDAIFVKTEQKPWVAVGDKVTVTGTVRNELRPDSGQLPATKIEASGVRAESHGNALPAPVRIGKDGLQPPHGNASAGIPFWQSLEGMRVEVQRPKAVGASNAYGEMHVVAERGAQLSDNRTARGGARRTESDIHPEVICVRSDAAVSNGYRAYANLGDTFDKIEGVVSYDFGRYKVVATAEPARKAASVRRETTPLVGTDTQVTIATMNLKNLDPKVEDGTVTDRGVSDVDDDVGTGRFARLGEQIAKNLGSPDIVGLQEIQDNDGAEKSDVTSASETFRLLIEAIEAAGGPKYEWISRSPVSGKDGGQPNGNIRVGFLYRPDRVTPDLSAVERLGARSPAFKLTRKSLSVPFTFRGNTFTVINNHFSAKLGSSPTWGTQQPPVNGQVGFRDKQAQLINREVREITKADPTAKVVVLGDFNENEFNSPLSHLQHNALVNLTLKLPPEQRYSYVFEGVGQQIDHMLVTPNLAAEAEVDVVHVNTDYAEQASDHDPVITRLTF